MAPIRLARAPLVALTLVVVSLGARRHVPAAASAAQPRGRLVDTMPECPRGGMWSAVFGRGGIAIVPGGRLSLSGPITDVPEFHDCQRFIVKAEGGRPVFDSLFAIFARLRLDSPDYEPLTRPLALAEIYSFQRGAQNYAPLGIRPHFNCLVVYPSPSSRSGLEARMVSVGREERRCGADSIVTAAGTVLEVRRIAPPRGLAPADIPPVARWDWDSLHAVQYIGIRCGDAWCEIGPRGPQGAEAFSSSRRYSSNSGDPTVRRTFEVKGWYDEQRLAEPIAENANMLAVGVPTGTLVPDAKLDTYDEPPPGGVSAFTDKWVPAASAVVDVASDVYREKLNMGHGLVGPGMNQVELCSGSTVRCLRRGGKNIFAATWLAATLRCADDWLARIRRNTDSRIAYYCVTRRSHAAELKEARVRIRGTARWRWAIRDETMWLRCLQGCCEIEAE